MADHASALGDPGFGPEVLDAIGVLDLHGWEGAAELRDGFALGLSTQNVLGRAARSSSVNMAVFSHSARAGPRRGWCSGCGGQVT